MEKTTNRSIKLLILYDVLLRSTDEKHPLSTSELIAELAKRGIAVSERVLPSDVALLNQYGYSVSSYKKRTRYYYAPPPSFVLAENRPRQDGNPSTKITVGNGATYVENGEFAYYDKLTSVTLSDGVTALGDCAFFNCRSLTDIILGNGLRTIGHSAFSWCRKIKSIVLPDSVRFIGGAAFSNCDSLTSVRFENPNGWRAGDVPLAASDLENAETAAIYLKEIYRNKPWTKKIDG